MLKISNYKRKWGDSKIRLWVYLSNTCMFFFVALDMHISTLQVWFLQTSWKPPNHCDGLIFNLKENFNILFDLRWKDTCILKTNCYQSLKSQNCTFAKWKQFFKGVGFFFIQLRSGSVYLHTLIAFPRGSLNISDPGPGSLSIPNQDPWSQTI